MRTVLLLGIAAGTLLLANQGHSATVDPVSRTDSAALAVILPDTTQIARDHASHPPLDYGADYRGDDRVYTGAPDRDPAESDYRRTVDTDYEGRWTGTWTGTYEAPDGGEYHGTYEGSYEGAAGTDYPSPGYDVREYERYAHEDAEMARLCRRDNGAGGAVIGAAVGGIAGNRIAGRGSRTEGTLIGAGVGALAGAAIDKAEDRERCESWWARRGADGGYYSRGGYYTQGHGYYSPGAVVTTIIMPQQYVTEEVTTTTVTYENVAVAKKRHAPRKRVYRAKPKPRCICR